ncbi:MAG: formate/nitrite transporter family protein [Thermoleophilia bacterium]
MTDAAPPPPTSLDALPPPAMARRAEDVGTAKAGLGALDTLVLAALAGAFIALGAAFSNAVTAGGVDLPYGVARLLGGLAFSLGLILVVVAGAELFTGNALIVMAWASRRVTTARLLRNWSLVFVGNAAGAIATAGLVYAGGVHRFGGGSVGAQAIATAVHKTGLSFGQAIALGVLCNGLVCLAVWLTYSAHSTTDKVFAIVFPITAFVAAGFEHSIANLYFLPYALFVEHDAAVAAATHVPAGAGPTWGSFLVDNLLPVTIGNVLGGTCLVAAVYWLVYLRPGREVPSSDDPPATGGAPRR